MSDPEPTTVVSAAPALPVVSTAVIVAGNEETRVLLRGLVRFQRFHVVGEAEGSTDGLHLIRQHRPMLVLIEAGLSEGSAVALIQATHTFLPTSRIVVVGTVDPQGGPVPKADSITYLRKPFRIAEFALAIGREPPAA